MSLAQIHSIRSPQWQVAARVRFVWAMDYALRLRSTRPTKAPIARRVADKHGVTLDDLKGPSRKPKFAHPRQEAYAQLADAGHSLHDIGRFFGNRDHCTVWKGIRAHKRRMAQA